jgi:hypothetical protein
MSVVFEIASKVPTAPSGFVFGTGGGSPPPTPSPNQIGMNVAAGGGSYFGGEDFKIFQNIIRESKFATTFGGGTLPALGTNGWPNGSNGTFSIVLHESAQSSLQSWMSGTFHIGYQSTGSETLSIHAGGGTLTSTGTNGNGYKTFTWSGLTAPQFGLDFSGVTTPITNMYCYIPGAALASTGAIDDPTQTSSLNPAYTALLSGVPMLRFMWVEQGAGNSALSTSASRRTPSNTQFYQFWNSSEGYPVEWCCTIAVGSGCGGWFNFPIQEDATNAGSVTGGAGSYTNAAVAVIASTVVAAGLDVVIEIGNENWNGNYNTYPELNSLTSAAGFGTSSPTSQGQYMGARMHELAVACRANSTIAPVFGTQVKLALCWQPGLAGAILFFNAACSYISTNFYSGGIQQDIDYFGFSVYVSESAAGVGDLDSISTIQSKMNAQGVLQATQNKMENTVIFALHNSAQVVTYESGVVQAFGSDGGITNLGAAILDSAWQPVVATDKTAIFNSGCSLDMHFEHGVDNSTANPAPEWEYTTTYANLTTSPTWLAVQEFASGPTITRNVIGTPGAGPYTISGGNDADVLGGSNPTLSGTGLAPYPSAVGYKGWIVYSTTGGTYSLAVNNTGTGTTNIEIGNYPNGFTIPYTGKSLASGSNSIGSITLVKGWNYVLLGNGTTQSGVTITSLVFT